MQTIVQRATRAHLHLRMRPQSMNDGQQPHTRSTTFLFTACQWHMYVRAENVAQQRVDRSAYRSLV